MKYKLASIPMIDVGVFPLHLSLPNELNTGGFILPGVKGESVYSYSSIDLLIAGLNADYKVEVISDLATYFSLNRDMISDAWVVLSVLVVEDNDYTKIITHSVLEWKHIVKMDRNRELLRIFKRNAPLTFKWIKL